MNESVFDEVWQKESADDKVIIKEWDRVIAKKMLSVGCQ